MKYFFICGESSGDRISSLIAAELIQNHGAKIQAMGGPQLEKAGVEIIEDYSPLNIMGWTQVIKSLPRIFKLSWRLKSHIKTFNPDTVVLIDNAGFNLRIAAWCKSQGYRVVYLIPPKTWASREGRIPKIKSSCDELIVLYPFEKQHFEDHGLPVNFYGHPLAGILRDTSTSDSYRSNLNLDSKPIISLLPGSRKEEVRLMLPIMLTAALQYSNYNICISCAPSIEPSFIDSFLIDQDLASTSIIKGDTYQLLKESYISLVTSGTATMEAAIIGTPMIVCYKMGAINFQIAKRLILTPYISLPNLILNETVVPELIQENCTVDFISAEINLLFEDSNRKRQQSAFETIFCSLHNINAISLIAKAIST